MSKDFKPGFKYVFTKKKFIKSAGKKLYSGSTKVWVNEINGREVMVIDSCSGNCMNYVVLPAWCKCIGKEI